MDEKLLGEIPAMVHLIKGLVELVGRCSVKTGECVCGVAYDHHPEAMDCGHAFVDSGEYNARSLYTESVQLLQRIGEYTGETRPRS